MSDWEDFCEANGMNVGSMDDYDDFVDSLAGDTYDHSDDEDEKSEDIDLDQYQAYYLIDNLIRRASANEGKPFHFTDTEIKSLNYAMKKIKPSMKKHTLLGSEDSDETDFYDGIPF